LRLSKLTLVAMTGRNIFHVYVDESSQTGHAFMVIGAIFCSKDAASEIAGMMDACLADHGQRADKEFHWTELKAHTLELYKDVMARLIGFTVKPRKMRYRALVVDMRQVNHALSKGRDREVTLATFIFTLVFGSARNFGPNIRYHVWIDKRADSVHDLEMDQRTFYALNNKAKSQFGWAEGPFSGVRFVDSKKSRLIQATDLITGAIAYETNGKHLLADASRHRVALLEHTIACSAFPTLAKPSSRWPFSFQISHFDFAKSSVGRD
jgi:hypothetical protein